MMRHLLKTAVPAVLLAACTSLPMPVPASHPDTVRQRWQVNKPDPTLAVIAPAAEGSLRFLWTDALGLPLARQKLTGSQWQDDGLLPPKREARPLFTALLMLQMDDAARVAAFPAVQLERNESGYAAIENGKTRFTYDCTALLPECRTALHTLNLNHQYQYQIKQIP